MLLTGYSLTSPPYFGTMKQIMARGGVVSKNNVAWEATGIDVYGAPDSDPNFIAMLLGDVNGSWKPQDDENALPASYFVGLDADKIGPEFQWFSEFIA